MLMTKYWILYCVIQCDWGKGKHRQHHGQFPKLLLRWVVYWKLCDCMCDSLCLLQDARTIHQVLSALIAQPVSSLLVTVLVLVENRSGNSFFYPTGVRNVCCVSLWVSLQVGWRNSKLPVDFLPSALTQHALWKKSQEEFLAPPSQNL